MTRIRIDTNVDTDLLEKVRSIRPGWSDDDLLDEALQALLDREARAAGLADMAGQLTGAYEHRELDDLRAEWD